MTDTNFPLEKILNVNIRDYVESRGKTLDQYELSGVHTSEAEIKKFAELVPERTEAVVNYQMQFFGAGAGTSLGHGPIRFRYKQTGTALIPRD